MIDFARAAEFAARNSYGRLLAVLAKKTSDIAMAEDALAEAFAKALTTWPNSGIPEKPEAWLLTVARNNLTDVLRRQTRWETDEDFPERIIDNTQNHEFPDERLALMMVCAHQAISPDLHAPLMLQTVLGLSAATIAELFLTSPAALAKQLVRAKAKIRDSQIPFQIPEPSMFEERSRAIADAIYALHAHDWLDPSDSLGREALFLADLACQLVPDDPELKGLAALIAFSHARVNARVNGGILVPTEDQDINKWNPALIEYGRIKLLSASRQGQIGRFQLEAAIEEVHINRYATGKTDWEALDLLYRGLLDHAPNVGAAIAHAAVISELEGPSAGLARLEEIEFAGCSAYQPLWAVRAALLSRLGKVQDADSAFETALQLTKDPVVIGYLQNAKHENSISTSKRARPYNA